MSVIELSELKYFWQQRAPAGHHLMHAIQSVMDKYQVSASDRVMIGSALQEFTDELLTVHERLTDSREKNPL